LPLRLRLRCVLRLRLRVTRYVVLPFTVTFRSRSLFTVCLRLLPFFVGWFTVPLFFCSFRLRFRFFVVWFVYVCGSDCSCFVRCSFVCSVAVYVYVVHFLVALVRSVVLLLRLLLVLSVRCSLLVLRTVTLFVGCSGFMAVWFVSRYVWFRLRSVVTLRLPRCWVPTFTLLPHTPMFTLFHHVTFTFTILFDLLRLFVVLVVPLILFALVTFDVLLLVSLVRFGSFVPLPVTTFRSVWFVRSVVVYALRLRGWLYVYCGLRCRYCVCYGYGYVRLVVFVLVGSVRLRCGVTGSFGCVYVLRCLRLVVVYVYFVVTVPFPFICSVCPLFVRSFVTFTVVRTGCYRYVRVRSLLVRFYVLPVVRSRLPHVRSLCLRWLRLRVGWLRYHVTVRYVYVTLLFVRLFTVVCLFVTFVVVDSVDYCCSLRSWVLTLLDVCGCCSVLLRFGSLPIGRSFLVYVRSVSCYVFYWFGSLVTVVWLFVGSGLFRFWFHCVCLVRFGCVVCGLVAGCGSRLYR